MRGTRLHRRLLRRPVRSIPAHAGNTRRCPRPGTGPAVHPRACGEHPADRLAKTKAAGPSPRMRGTRGQMTARFGQARSIPAHAGNTRHPDTPCARAAVHPRACGEHASCGPTLSLASGPSPRMRGTPAPARPDASSGRSIPAHAGNTPAGRSIPALRAVHPRACGEHRKEGRTPKIPGGPSPRMRGTQERGSNPENPWRSIPAHAGNTVRFPVVSSGLPVHPRACGEHVAAAQGLVSRIGPSPRMRGTLISVSPVSELTRSIPAHAGNTVFGSRMSIQRPVHPRACGEHFILSVKVN